MDMTSALTAFSALSQQTRLEAFRLLVTAGDAGMSAGDIAEALDVRQNTPGSYTHLTLPTSDLVSVSVVAVSHKKTTRE